MNRNTAKTTDPIWDSRNAEEPTGPLEWEIWGTPGQPVVIVLRAHGTKKYWLAHVQTDRPKMSRAELACCLEGFRRLGKVTGLSK